MPSTETHEALKLMALDEAGQISLQDDYLSLEDFYVMKKESVSAKTWDFILKSEVDLRSLEYVNPAHNLLKNYFLNLPAKKDHIQKEALALWLEMFRRSDFLGQNKLWTLMEDTLAENFKHFKNESKRLILRALISAIPACLTHHLRGEILIWLLPGDSYEGFLSAETPKAWEKILSLYCLFSKKNLILLLSFAEKQEILDSLTKSNLRNLCWQLYFGLETPASQNEKISSLDEARNLENKNQQLCTQELEKLWQALGDESEESTAAMIEYLKKDLQKSTDYSAAVLELLSMFCHKKLKNNQKLHIIETLLSERSFSDPIKETNYRSRDYLAVIELFNACPLERTLIMTYFYQNKDAFEELRAYLAAELQAFQEDPDSIFAKPYYSFQKNYRRWFMASKQEEREKRTE